MLFMKHEERHAKNALYVNVRQIEFVCLFMFNAILIEMVITSTHYNRFTAISADDIIHNYKAGSFIKQGGGMGECAKR